MANKPKKYCSHHPCSNLVESGHQYCSIHAHTVQRDGSSDPFYGTARWQRFREWYRARHPLCELCLLEGLTIPMDVVDHIVELKDGGAKLSEDNAMSLCNACHAKKTAKERKKRGPVVYAYKSSVRREATASGQ